MLVFPDPGAPPANPNEVPYTIALTYAILENSTELGLEPIGDETEVEFEVFWSDSDSATFTIEFADPSKPTYVNLDVDDPAAHDTRHNHLAVKNLKVTPGTAVVVRVKRTLQPLLAVSLVFELWPETLKLPADRMSRQVGLFAVTKAADELRLDLAQVRIVRNESNSDPAGPDPVAWSRDKMIRIVPMNGAHEEADPIDSIQRWVSCLPPCQEFLARDQNGGDIVRW